VAILGPMSSPAPPSEQPTPRTPTWLTPPDNEIPCVVALNRVLVETGELVVRVPHASVYRDGVDVAVIIQSSPFATPVDPRASDEPQFSVDLGDGPVLAQGSRELGPLLAQRVTPPVLRRREGGGVRGRRTLLLWLWPLPDGGRIALGMQWPSAGVAGATVELDGAGLRSAARHAREAWPDPRPEWRPPPAGS
jgi:hypothetical protein